MKKLIIILFLLSLFTSCRKEQTPVVPVDETLNPVYMNISIDTINSPIIKVY